MAGAPPTLERTLSDMQRWPSAREIDNDRAEGETLVAALMPFVLHMYELGLSASALRRPINNLWPLGGEIIRERNYEVPPGAIPPLLDIIDEEGGPLLYRAEEDEQRPRCHLPRPAPLPDQARRQGHHRHAQASHSDGGGHHRRRQARCPHRGCHARCLRHLRAGSRLPGLLRADRGTLRDRGTRRGGVGHRVRPDGRRRLGRGVPAGQD